MPKKIVEKVNENIITQSLDDLMSDRYASYAKYVILDRAIPNVNDGLKPVQRRIIYSMFTNKNFYDGQTKKCAKIVGDVMGRFHPHGDTSIYEALARMSQTWKMNVPIITFQGNNGSIDGDGPAAYRYTEAKLSKYAELFVKNLSKKPVDFTLNFDDEEYEPIVLPAYAPNLFINGIEGIGVGFSSKIPPHNFTEMCQAVIKRLNEPNSSLDDIMEIVKGPDFPTGGIIYDNNGIRQIYETGSGKFDLGGRYKIEEAKDFNIITIYEIPYGVNKQNLVYLIDQIRKNKDVDGINDVKDLSNGDDIRITIELKKEIKPEVVIKYLSAKAPLRISFNAKNYAICDNHPRLLPLLDYLDIYISFLKEINVKSLNYDLKKANERLLIVEGFIKAFSIIEELIALIRNSKNRETARNSMVEQYEFTPEQADAILELHLYKLTHTDVQIYYDEEKELKKEVKRIKELLQNETSFKNYLIDILNEEINTFGYERKTEITNNADSISVDKRDLISKEDTYVVLTRDGYIKRSSIKSYNACLGQLPGIKEGDNIVMSMLVNTLDYVLAFTNLGNYLFIPVHEIIENKWKDEGKHINYLINLPLNEYVIKAIVVSDFSIDCSIGLISKKGQIKKTKLSDFFAQRYSKPISCMKLYSDDELVDVSVLNNNSNLLIIANNGIGTFFNENEISQTGIKSGGVKAISRLKEGSLLALIPINNEEKSKLLFVTDKGMTRIYDSRNLELTNRLGKTQIVFKSFKSDPHKLINYFVLTKKEDNVVLNGIYDNNVTFIFTIDGLHITPIDKYCKRNINEMPEDRRIKYIFKDSCSKIDENFKTEKPLKTKNNITNSSREKSSDEEVHYEQISLFDDMGD